MADYDIPTATDRDVYITRSFDAPVELVWRFFTEPDLLAQWVGPHGVGVDVGTVTVQQQVGGSWNLAMHDEHGVYPIEAEILVVVPNEYLELRMRAETREGTLDDELLRIRFHDHGEKTRITLHQGPFTPEFRDMTQDGWNQSFEKLDAVLAQG